MTPEIVLRLVQFGVLAVLWLFVLTAVRVVRSDLYGTRGARPPRRPAATPPPKRGKGRSAARRVVVTEGSLAGTTIELRGEPVTFGRAADSTLVLTDDYASSRHARLVPGDGQWLVEDLGSTNGTFLDREKVTRPTPVPIGTPIRIGKTALELRR